MQRELDIHFCLPFHVIYHFASSLICSTIFYFNKYLKVDCSICLFVTAHV